MKIRNGFAPLIIIVIIAAVAVIGGGVALVWRTTYLDPILPSTVREFLRRGGAVPSSESSAETPSETPSEESEPPAEDLTKGWKTYTNEKLGFSFKYPPTWVVTENAYQGPGGPATTIKGPEASMDIHIDFQGGFEGDAKAETKDYYTTDGVWVPATIFYGYAGGSEDNVLIFAAPYSFKANLTFFLSFDRKTYPEGFEMFSQIISTLRSY